MIVLAVVDLDERRVMHDHLTESGFTVVDSSSVTEVVPLASRFFADIAVIDLDGFGYDALIAARELGGGKKTVAIGLTCCAATSILALAKKAGFVAVLDKPCAPETLFTEIVLAIADAEARESRQSGNS